MNHVVDVQDEHMALDLTKLTPTMFENLTYDLLQASGMRSLVWRTPGTDGGRDIQGTFLQSDFSGHHHLQQWYVECKRYVASIDWPTVWKKIAYADSQGADFLLIVTNSNPSPQCETEISNWNATKGKPLVRVWRGYEVEYLLSTCKVIAAKYGLADHPSDTILSISPLVLQLMKAAQDSYTAIQFGLHANEALEANAALAELLSLRLEQMLHYGKFVPSAKCDVAPEFDWLTWVGNVAPWEEIGLRAFLTMLRYITRADDLNVLGQDESAQIECRKARFPLDPSTMKTLVDIAQWADIELHAIDGATVQIEPRAG